MSRTKLMVEWKTSTTYKRRNPKGLKPLPYEWGTGEYGEEDDR